MEREIARSSAALGSSLCLGNLLDVDNQDHQRPAGPCRGDAVLVPHLAHGSRAEVMRPQVPLARYGGEEFKARCPTPRSPAGVQADDACSAS